MSALANFTTTPLPLTLFSNIPIGGHSSPPVGFPVRTSDALPHPVQLRHRRRKTSNGHRRNRTGHEEEEGDDDEEREKKRRSLNIPEDGKAKELRLFNTRTNSFVQIQEDGTVRTGTQTNSIHSIFEVLFWCHLAPHLFQPCSHSPSSFSAIIMRFKASGRFLCMSHSGKIYTQIPPGHSLVGVENCIFQHEFLSNQYDVYYSWRYPNGTQHCERQRLHNGPDGGSSCQNRWYLGVDRKGRVCSVKSPKSNIRRNSFFIQRWIHDRGHGQGQGRPEYPNPLLTSSPTPVAERDGVFKAPPSTGYTTTRVGSVFGIHSQRRRHERARVSEGEATGVEGPSRRGCLNLLKKCERLGRPGKVS